MTLTLNRLETLEEMGVLQSNILDRVREVKKELDKTEPEKEDVQNEEEIEWER